MYVHYIQLFQKGFPTRFSIREKKKKKNNALLRHEHLGTSSIVGQKRSSTWGGRHMHGCSPVERYCIPHIAVIKRFLKKLLF